MFVRLAVLSYLMCACVSVFGGDGRLIDKGPLEPNWRYILDLGPVLLDQDGSYSFEIEGLPSAEFVVGFEVKLIPIRDVSDRKRLSRTTNHVLLETASFSEWKLWPENAYAIGQNGTGDALVIFRRGTTFEPEIFVWRHEDGTLELVADDFSNLRVA